jgi:hypothetical protein
VPKGDLLANLGTYFLKLGLEEKLGLIGNLEALMNGGQVEARDVLETITKLAGDPDPVVGKQVAAFIGRLRKYHVGEKLRSGFERYIQKVFAPRTEKLGWIAGIEDERTRTLRTHLLGLIVRHGGKSKIRAEGARLGRKWLKKLKGLDIDLAKVALDASVTEGDRTLFDQILDEARKTKNTQVRRLLLSALGGFVEPELAKAALDVLASGKFKFIEAVGIVGKQLREPRTREITYEFFKANQDRVLKVFPPIIANYLFRVGGHICGEKYLDDFKAAFGEKAAAIPGGLRAFKTALETIQLNTEIRKAHAKSVAAFFEKY